MFPRRRYDEWHKSGPPCGEYPLAREGRLTPRRLSTTSGVRQRLIDTKQASWDWWRSEGRMCEFECALKAGESVVLSGSERAHEGLPYGGEGRARERLYLLDEFDQIREYFGDV